MAAGLKLSVFAGERDHVGGRLLSDAMMGAWAAAGVGAAVLLRGVEGFGLGHHLHTEQLLTLSEDLPVLALAVDRPERILELREQVLSQTRHGLIAIERVTLPDGTDAVAEAAQAPAGELKLTLLAPRAARSSGGPAHVAAVAAMRRSGMAGAAALLGVDGVSGGRRLRAGLLRGNGQVPVLISGVGSVAAVQRSLAEIATIAAVRPLTLERVRICRCDGAASAPPHEPPAGARGWWQKIVVQSGERDARGRLPLHDELVRGLRAAGATGATALRALWGYGGAHEPHGERLLSLTRDVPVQTVICDTPDGVRRWWGLVEELTAGTGLVTSELIPALRASAPGVVHGGLELAAPPEPGGTGARARGDAR